MNRALMVTTTLAALGLALPACGSSSGGPDAGSTLSGTTGAGSSGGGNGGGLNTGGPTATVGASSDGGIAGTLPVTIRDFKFYDANDPSTVPDFENPPTNVDGNGNPAQGYAGPWDDPKIVTNTLGSDGKPVYANASGGTLTTHGKADFDKWYNDVPGTNIDVAYPLPITQQSDGSFGYDSRVDGVPTQGDPSNVGFFPIDDGSKYQTTFGNQGKPHNYSFTAEIHTVFTYKGGEVFKFLGDDDVFVYINGQLAINLGGIHGAEEKDVQIDSLGLTVGQTYPLDFFSAERHVTQSNIIFTTTLNLQPKQVQ